MRYIQHKRGNTFALYNDNMQCLKVIDMPMDTAKAIVKWSGIEVITMRQDFNVNNKGV